MMSRMKTGLRGVLKHVVTGDIPEITKPPGVKQELGVEVTEPLKQERTQELSMMPRE